MEVTDEAKSGIEFGLQLWSAFVCDIILHETKATISSLPALARNICHKESTTEFGKPRIMAQCQH